MGYILRYTLIGVVEKKKSYILYTFLLKIIISIWIKFWNFFIRNEKIVIFVYLLYTIFVPTFNFFYKKLPKFYIIITYFIIFILNFNKHSKISI